jgi:hypothetical protein
VFRNYLTSNSLKVFPLNHFEPIKYTPLYKSLNTFAKEKGNFTSMICYFEKLSFVKTAKTPIKSGFLWAISFSIAAFWRKRWDSNPRAREGYLISSFIKCVSGSVSFVSVSASFVLGAKPHKHWLFHAKAPKKPVISGKFE